MSGRIAAQVTGVQITNARVVLMVALVIKILRRVPAMITCCAFITSLIKYAVFLPAVIITVLNVKKTQTAAKIFRALAKCVHHVPELTPSGVQIKNYYAQVSTANRTKTKLMCVLIIHVRMIRHVRICWAARIFCARVVCVLIVVIHTVQLKTVQPTVTAA